MIQNYKKEGVQNSHKDLFFALDELDHIAEAFEILSSYKQIADLE